MTTRVSSWLGPLALLLFWPVFLYHRKIRGITKEKEREIEEIRKKIQGDVEDYQKVLINKVERILASVNPHPECKKPRRERGIGGRTRGRANGGENAVPGGEGGRENGGRRQGNR